MKVRLLLATLVMLIPSDFSLTQPKQNSANSPTVSISLPADIPSELVQIRYFLIGSFGGYGGYVEPKSGQTAYEIEAFTAGEPAKSIKILIYAQGCRFQTFDLDLTQFPISKERFVCESLPSVRITGEVPSDLIRDENTELNVRYVAIWANRFFGIADGPVPEFQVATTRPDSEGNFRLDISDFSVDKTASSYQGGASLSFMLRDSKTLNPIALNLGPEEAEYQSEIHGLRILPSYRNGIKFVNSSE